MHQFFGEIWAYKLFNVLSVVVPIVLSFFYFKTKRDSISIYSKYIIRVLSNSELKLGKFTLNFGNIIEFLLVSVESVVMVYIVTISSFNREFGELVGTGANYFALLFTTWLFVILASTLILSNPIKQLDFTTQLLPIHIAVVRLACFCQGCCWGIPWKYGLYNHHYDHPGNQVPVQAIEAFFALAIFAFLLIYRRKAKTGTMFPMYMVLYSGARFFIEFFTAAYPDIIGPFNMYQILCVIGFVVGLVVFFVMRKYGEKLSDAFDEKVNGVINGIARREEQRIAEENARIEAEMKERLEKAKAARAKASVKYRKK